MSYSVAALGLLGVLNRCKPPDGGCSGEKVRGCHAYLQLRFSVFVAERIIGPSPVGVGVAKPLSVLSAVFSGLF